MKSYLLATALGLTLLNPFAYSEGAPESTIDSAMSTDESVIGNGAVADTGQIIESDIKIEPTPAAPVEKAADAPKAPEATEAAKASEAASAVGAEAPAAKVSGPAPASAAAPDALPIQVAAKGGPLKLPAYSFDPVKLRAADDVFHFLRSFVDFFYLVVKNNEAELPTITSLSKTTGWCVGDAHPENFGALIQQNGASIFTVNDIDDAGPCPLVLDVVRLAVAARLADKEFKVKPILDAYSTGQSGEPCHNPDAVLDLLTKSRKRGTGVNPKKLADKKLVRDEGAAEVNDAEKKEILEALKNANLPFDPAANLIDILGTAKVGGGSGGLPRFELLFQNGKDLLHMELKEEIKPSIYPVAAGAIPSFPDRLAKSLSMEQGPGASKLYAAIKIHDKDYLVRPRFYGNTGVAMDKNSFGDNKVTIQKEACLLGIFHANASAETRGWVENIDALKTAPLEEEIKRLADAISAAFAGGSAN